VARAGGAAAGVGEGGDVKRTICGRVFDIHPMWSWSDLSIGLTWQRYGQRDDDEWRQRASTIIWIHPLPFFLLYVHTWRGEQ
jgi:hypothetical protein